MPDEKAKDVIDRVTYTVEQIAKFGFKPTGHSFADLQIYGRGRDRCLFKPLPDGRLNAYMTYQF